MVSPFKRVFISLMGKGLRLSESNPVLFTRCGQVLEVLAHILSVIVCEWLKMYFRLGIQINTNFSFVFRLLFHIFGTQR